MPAPGHPHPLEGFWTPGVLVWVLLAGEGLAAVLALAPQAQDRLVYFGLASLVIQWISILALTSIFLLRSWLGRLRPLQLAYVALAALIGSSWLVAVLAWLGLREFWPVAPESWLGFSVRLVGITVVVGLFGLLAFQNHWRAKKLAVRTKQLELESLQARIHPHFLFNTLNTGAALVHAQPEQAERLLLDLSDLFRAALSGPREVALSEEMALTRRYLEIELLRLGPRLRLRWDVPATLPDVQVPALSIQPLAENAVRHGVEPSPDGGDVHVVVEVDELQVRVIVANDVPAGASAAAKGFNIGLASARERVKAMSYGQASLETTNENGRYLVALTLPRNRSATPGSSARGQASTR